MTGTRDNAQHWRAEGQALYARWGLEAANADYEAHWQTWCREALEQDPHWQLAGQAELEALFPAMGLEDAQRETLVALYRDVAEDASLALLTRFLVYAMFGDERCWRVQVYGIDFRPAALGARREAYQLLLLLLGIAGEHGTYAATLRRGVPASLLDAALAKLGREARALPNATTASASATTAGS